jgi:glycosyltransferase involved in cell wall biosynthesis
MTPAINSNPDSNQSGPVILTLLPWYLPGCKAGGPIRSVDNLVTVLGKEFHFRIATADRDLGDAAPYSDIDSGRWTRVGEADVMYLPPGWRGHLKMIELLRTVDTSTVLYLNGFFSRRFSMLAIFMGRLGLFKCGRILIAPRGEFSPGALGLKRVRKRIYIALARLLGLYRTVMWHASTEWEAADIRRCFPGVSNIGIANIVQATGQLEGRADRSVVSIAKDIGILAEPDDERSRQKRAGQLRVVFVSRISPKKNLLAALTVLQGVSGEVSFDIYGPAEDAAYWNRCQAAIKKLPANIHVTYRGMVEHAKIHGVFAEHDLFLFPTLGENYGHVICEALTAGCPVLISDQTPWRDLEQAGVGWDIPLGEMERFQAAVQLCVDADGQSYEGMAARARAYGARLVSDPAVIEDNRRMFQYASGRLTL